MLASMWRHWTALKLFVGSIVYNSYFENLFDNLKVNIILLYDQGITLLATHPREMKT